MNSVNSQEEIYRKTKEKLEKREKRENLKISLYQKHKRTPKRDFDPSEITESALSLKREK